MSEEAKQEAGSEADTGGDGDGTRESGGGLGFETRMIHAGVGPDPVTGSRQTPIHQTSAYAFHDADHAASLFNLQTFGFIYSRLGNPTVAALEERIASLEGGRGATGAASGHAAQVLAFFPLIEAGERFAASNRLYGGSVTQFSRTFPKFDWRCDFVDTEDLSAVEAVLAQGAKALFVESPGESGRRGHRPRAPGRTDSGPRGPS